VLPSLLPEFAGKVNLIYIDPPFDTGADFSFTATVPEDPDDDDDSFTFTKEPSIIEHKAYRDTWGRGLESYLQWFYETTGLLHELLHENGSLYVHLDYHVAHYAKCLLDEIFGPESFQNEIVWQRNTAHNNPVRYGPIHDVIFYYTKSGSPTWNRQYTEYDKDYIEGHFTNKTSDGRLYRINEVTGSGLRSGDSGKPWKGNDPSSRGRHWAIPKVLQQKFELRGTTQQMLDQLDRRGYIEWGKGDGNWPRLRYFRDEMKGVLLQDIWTDVYRHSDPIYATQKPELLLERMVKASSNEGDLVLDCFCGSGTTAAVAETHSRRWIACDLGRFAIHTTRKRLLSIPDVRPFSLQNLGKYERQLWAGAEFGDNQAAERQRAYIKFILKLAQATPLNGYTWLHATKGGRMVHVGAVDAPVSVGDVTQIAAEFKRAIGTGKDAPKTNGVDVLGWDFAFELNEVAKQQAAMANIQMRFLRIPRDVMDKRAVEQGDIKFFELAALSVEVKTNKRNAFLKLKDFVIPPDDVPDEVRKAVKHWSQWIDYWAVDWDNRSDTFHNEWQTYRTRKDKSLQLEIMHTYADPGDYTIVLKVIDILGNDTTKTVKVKVG
jgi:adenine-specific DNA-methyltransferase